MTEPLPKRLKTYKDQFWKCCFNSRGSELVLEHLRNDIRDLKHGISITAGFLRVLSCDADSCKSFSKATCNVEGYKLDDGNLLVSTVYPFFADGINVLEKFLEGRELPLNEAAEEALKLLMKFLLSYQTPGDDWEKLAVKMKNSKSSVPFTVPVDIKNCEKESDLALNIIKHLVEPLSTTKNIFMDVRYSSPDQLRSDDDSCVNDTTFGVPDGWHGSADILVTGMPVAVMAEEDDRSDVSSIGTDLSTEVIYVKTISEKNKERMLAQTIVYSFLHEKQAGDSLYHKLVPSIGISKQQLWIHLYDCEEDVLVAVCPVDMFYKTANNYNFSKKAILLLWLAINHELFCSGIPEEYKVFKSGFHEKVNVHMYRQTVTKPLRIAKLVSSYPDLENQYVNMKADPEKIRLHINDFRKINQD